MLTHSPHVHKCSETSAFLCDAGSVSVRGQTRFDGVLMVPMLHKLHFPLPIRTGTLTYLDLASRGVLAGDPGEVVGVFGAESARRPRTSEATVTFRLTLLRLRCPAFSGFSPLPHASVLEEPTSTFS